MRLYYFITIVCIAFLFQGCGKEEDSPGHTETGEESSRIELSGLGIEAEVNSRALSDFPNNQTIGVLAAPADEGSYDWTVYSDINNDAAVIYREGTGGRFYFRFSPDNKYWPFDGSSLVFMAYSPVAGGIGSAVSLNADHTVLNIQLVPDMPDVMYVSNNTNPTVYSKNSTNRVVDLGEFRHALSQLTLKVIPDPAGTMNPAVRLKELTVQTTITSATLDLLQGDAGLTVNMTPGATVSYPLVTSDTAFAGGYTAKVILLPGSEANTQIIAYFSDGSFSVGDTYPVSSFANTDPLGGTITFQQGVNTTLQFTVFGTLVETPTELIHLQGQLTDWNQGTELGTTIN